MRMKILLVAFTVFALSLGVGTASARVLGTICECGCEQVFDPLCDPPPGFLFGPGKINSGWCLGQTLRASGGNRP